MKVEPVRKYPEPQLPTRDAVDAHPELLRLIPRRWQANAAVVTALVSAGILLQSGLLKAEDQPVIPGKMMRPMVTLTEPEARQIIVDEAKKVGVSFSPDAETLNLPLSSLDQNPGAEHTQPEMTSITLDGSDRKHKVSYEYISRADLQALSARRGHTVFATSAAAAIKARGKRRFKENVFTVTEVVGYDRESAENKLRAQVQDFIKWLKGQGVI